MSVLQEWVQNLTMMQQSVLISAVRAPDGIRKSHPVKTLMRWYRRCVLLSAMDRRVLTSPYEEGGGSFTGPLDKTNGTIEQFCGIFLTHIDELPHHFVLHLMHAGQILGYKHPDEWTRKYWATFYYMVVKHFHLSPESEEKMDRRLGDRRDWWLESETVPGL